MRRKQYRQAKSALKSEVRDLEARIKTRAPDPPDPADLPKDGAACTGCGVALAAETMVCPACGQVVEAHRARLQSLDKAISEKARAHDVWARETGRAPKKP